MGFGGPNCTGVWAPTELSYVTSSISVLLMLITFPGNLLVCLAILLDPYKELRTTFNYLLLSLATTDLLVGVFMDPLSAVYHYSEAKKLDLVSIKIMHVMFFILTTASLLTLAALTVGRYIAVTYPHTYRTKVTFKRALVTTAIIWAVSLGLSFIYFPLGYIYYAFIFANVAVISTFLVLVFVYWSIYKKLSAQMKLFHKTELHTDNNEYREKRSNLKLLKKDSKVTHAQVMVLIAFVICYTPACVMIYFLNMCSSCDCTLVHWFRDLQFVIVLLNSGVNPYLYAFRLPQFRRAFHKLVWFPVMNQVDSLVSFESKSEKINAPNLSEEVSKFHRIDWLQTLRESEYEIHGAQSATREDPRSSTQNNNPLVPNPIGRFKTA